MERALTYLEKSLQRERGTASLCWAMMALAAFDRYPPDAAEILFQVFQRTRKLGRAPYKLALLVLASSGPGNPLVPVD
jgi:hypothetical protein